MNSPSFRCQLRLLRRHIFEPCFEDAILQAKPRTAVRPTAPIEARRHGGDQTVSDEIGVGAMRLTATRSFNLFEAKYFNRLVQCDAEEAGVKFGAHRIGRSEPENRLKPESIWRNQVVLEACDGESIEGLETVIDGARPRAPELRNHVRAAISDPRWRKDFDHPPRKRWPVITKDQA